MRMLLASLILVVIASTATVHAADATLAAARELYASASYDEALAMLDELGAATQAREDRQSIALYRILCLTALGRATDADRVMDALIADEPLYRPSSDVSPRIQAAFSATRKRLLPALIQQQYAEAKGAFERQEWANAAAAFKRVLDELADPDMTDAAKQSPLADLRTLAGGFHDLSVKASAPPPAPVVVAAPPPPAVPLRDYRRIYNSGDPDVVQPIVVRQPIPGFAGRITELMNGVVEVIINQAGTVEAVRIIESVHPTYDRTLLAAAQKWQYEAATVDGIPVKFTKRVQVTITPPAQ